MSRTETFVRVYRLPEKLTDGFCVPAAVPITFLNVDWFNAPIEDGRAALTTFIKAKKYYRPGVRYLVLGDHPEFVFTIEPEYTVREESFV